MTTDSFTGTPGATLGGSWLSANSLLLKYTSNGTAVYGNGLAATASAYYNETTASDHYSYVIHEGDGSNSSFGAGVAVRMQTGADSYFYAHFGFGGHMYIGQQISGTGTDWEDITAAGDKPTAGQQWGLRVTGTTVEYVIAGVVKKTYTGKNALSGGRKGVIAYAEGGVSTSVQLASWEGGDITSGGVTTTIGQASYSFTPQNVTTKSAFRQTSDQASYSFTPQNVATSRTTANVMAAAQASYAFSPQSVTTVRSATYFTSIAQASYAFTPQNVATAWVASNLFEWDRVTGNEGYRVEWGQTSGGPYPNSANTATNVEAYNLLLPAFTTWYARVAALVGGTPQDYSVERVFTSGIPDFDPEAASYAFTPQNVTTRIARGQTSQQASYTFTPQNVATKSGFARTSDQASYAFTPQNVATTTIRGFTTIADQVGYSFTPRDITTRQSITVEPVGQASYAFTPQDIITSTIKAYVMAADQAGYTLTPQNVLTIAFLSRVLAVGYALYSFTPYGVAIPGEVAPGDVVRRRNNKALAARLWRNKQELARKLFEGI